MKLSKLINAYFSVCILIIFFHVFMIFSVAEDLTSFSDNEHNFSLSYVYYEVIEYFESNNINNYHIGIDEANNRIIVEVYEENYSEISESLNNKYGQMVYIVNTDLVLNKTNTYYMFFVCMFFFICCFLWFILFFMIKKIKSSVKITNEGQLYLKNSLNVSIINELKSCKVSPNDSLYNKIIKEIEEVKKNNSLI